jgi:hypothetical protein
MLIFDFNRWLGSEQFLGAASDVLFQTNPQSTSGVWIPFPGGGCCLQDTQAAPPPDTNPLSLAGLTIMPDGKRVELSLSAGTPGLAYLASFIATAGPYARRKEVGVTKPFEGDEMVRRKIDRALPLIRGQPLDFPAERFFYHRNSPTLGAVANWNNVVA